jgi:hypothetical protein
MMRQPAPPRQLSFAEAHLAPSCFPKLGRVQLNLHQLKITAKMGGSISKPDPTRRLEVIGAGYSRTGTVSMQLALEKLLNGPVMHGGTHHTVRTDGAYPPFQVNRAVANSEVQSDYNKTWVEAFEARRNGDKQRLHKLLRKLMDGYAGCTDNVICLFVPELLELYPDAKVVLATRDPDKWFPSMAGMLDHGMVMSPLLPILTWPAPGLCWVPRLSVEWYRVVQESLGGSLKKLIPMSPDVIRIHDQWVIDNVPKEKLLVTNVKEGWEPLCKFLAKPVPDEPFPHVNDAEALEKLLAHKMRGLLLRWVIILATAGGAAYGATQYLWRR